MRWKEIGMKLDCIKTRHFFSPCYGPSERTSVNRYFRYTQNFLSAQCILMAFSVDVLWIALSLNEGGYKEKTSFAFNYVIVMKIQIDVRKQSKYLRQSK